MDFDLMPEYLLEVGEHLSGISSGLLRLEELPMHDIQRTEILQSLFRSFHTVKGLSAMVEMTELERLSHQCEALLRFRNSQQNALAGDVIDVLISATSAMSERIQLLEKNGSKTSEGKQAFPEQLTRSLEHLKQILEESDAPPATGPAARRSDYPDIPERVLEKLTQNDVAKLRQGRMGGSGLYFTEFIPTRELLENGFSITTLMQRIAEHGKLIRNIPSTVARDQPGKSGQISFALLFHSNFSSAELKDRLGVPALDILMIDEAAVSAQSTAVPAGKKDTDDVRQEADQQAARQTVVRDDEDPAVVIRIGLHKMDEIMRLTGELMITKARLISGVQMLESSGSERELAYALSEDAQRLERGLRTLREAILETRLVPIREAFHRLPLVLRDIMRGAEKKARMTFSGDQIELDRMIVERLVDPLIHLVRNAFDHGIESPEQRTRCSKDPVGTIAVSAIREGNHVRIEIRDDGAGILTSKIFARARALEMDVPPESEFGMEDALRCLCHPGFSTKKVASRISGRGVGMDVVAFNVASLNGILSLESLPGEGSCFTMLIPITLSITEAMLVRAAGQTFAVPISMVSETVLISPDAVSRIDRNRVTRFREAAVATFALQGLYGLPGNFDWTVEKPALLTIAGKEQVLVAVDAFIGKQEVVIKSLEDPLVRVAGVIGAAELGNGQVILILDLPGMLAKQGRTRHVS